MKKAQCHNSEGVPKIIGLNAGMNPSEVFLFYFGIGKPWLDFKLIG